MLFEEKPLVVVMMMVVIAAAVGSVCLVGVCKDKFNSRWRWWRCDTNNNSDDKQQTQASTNIISISAIY